MYDILLHKKLLKEIRQPTSSKYLTFPQLIKEIFAIIANSQFCCIYFYMIPFKKNASFLAGTNVRNNSRSSVSAEFWALKTSYCHRLAVWFPSTLKVAEMEGRAGAKNVKETQRRSGRRPKMVKNRPSKKNAIFAPLKQTGGLTSTKTSLLLRNSALSAWGTEIQTDSVNPHSGAMVIQVFAGTPKDLRRIRI